MRRTPVRNLSDQDISQIEAADTRTGRQTAAQYAVRLLWTNFWFRKCHWPMDTLGRESDVLSFSDAPGRSRTRRGPACHSSPGTETIAARKRIAGNTNQRDWSCS